jgi:UDP-N-acetylglucosamine 2-epimerase (non-hydrolysing)
MEALGQAGVMGLGPMKTIVCIIGTRPEAIKMAPVILALQKAPWARCRVVLTGQHRDLVDRVLADWGIRSDVDLDVMKLKLPIDQLARHLVKELSSVLVYPRPDMVLAQGDTTSVLATAIAAFRLNIPFGHVEAGLRTGQLFAPFPEEANRVVASHLAAIHFAPTTLARTNLLKEGIDPGRIHVTGNTVIDALLRTAGRDWPIGVALDPLKRLILVTVHRRDSYGAPLKQICQAIQMLHDRHPEVEFLWPVHPNPAVKPVVLSILSGLPRVHLCEPMEYRSFVAAMKRAAFVLTDSGGIQEEAPALGKPVLVLRNESERPEAIEMEVAKLVGHDPRVILRESALLLSDPRAYRSMSRGASPYGDGRAAERIVSTLCEFLVGSANRRQTMIPTNQHSSYYRPIKLLTQRIAMLRP